MDAITKTFPEGLLHEGKLYKEFTLVTEAFQHTLDLLNNPAVQTDRLADESYYQACMLAVRLAVPGVETITPEMIRQLSGPDGRTLLSVSNELENRRRDFRSSIETAAQDAGSPAETGAELGNNIRSGSVAR